MNEKPDPPLCYPMSQPPRLDYRNQDLRNQSFEHQNLTDADFSGADIRGCNFSGANLSGANFERVKTGQSRTQFIIELASSIFTAVAVPLAAVVVGFLAGFFVVALAVFVAVAVAVTGLVAVSNFVTVAVANFAAVVVAVVIAVVIAVVGFLAGIVVVAALSAFNRGAIVEGIALSGLSVLLAGFAIYLFRELIQTIRNQLGTIFEDADLTNASFDHASIQNTDFSGATLEFVNWTDASFARCKLPKSFNDEIRALVTSLDGHDQDYRYANLKNLHLAGVILTGANLAEADLSGSKLNCANLGRANLRGIQASGTDFANAVLTGACIQHWGINVATRFTDVHCDYIYLEPNQQERRPASGIFQPGDFEKLVHQFTDTLDFLFRNGVDAEAFDAALKDLLTEYPDAGLSLHSLIDVGDGDRSVKFNVANPKADKMSMHARVVQVYSMRQKLKAERQKVQVLQQDLAHAEGRIVVHEKNEKKYETLLQTILGRPTVSIQNSQIGDVMSKKGNEVHINNTTGDVSGITGGDNEGVAGKGITGAAGGDISGTLTLTLGQLEATKDPEALKLADLLKQLKTAIEGKDAGLDAKDKEKALKHLDAIAKLGGDRKNPALLERADGALDALETIVKRGNGLLEFSEKYLPTITAGIKGVLAAWGVAL